VLRIPRERDQGMGSSRGSFGNPAGKTSTPDAMTS